MQKLAALQDAHRRIEQQIAQLGRVASAEVPDAASVAMLRWELAKALSDHRAQEDRELCARVLGSSDVLAVRAAWRHRQIAGTTQAVFLRFVAEWPVERVAADWGGIRRRRGGSARGARRTDRLGRARAVRACRARPVAPRRLIHPISG